MAKFIDILDKKSRQTHRRDASFGLVEKSIMLSCYISRKLYESKEIYDDCFHRDLDAIEYEHAGVAVDDINRQNIDDLYRLENGQKTALKFSFVINQIIHSYVFVYVFNESGFLEGIAFNSDHTKSKRLFFVRLSNLIQCFSTIARHHVYSATYFRAEDGCLVPLDIKDGNRSET